ncbi:hypothetical protein ACLOJK_031359 [Asimina triloba]
MKKALVEFGEDAYFLLESQQPRSLKAGNNRPYLAADEPIAGDDQDGRTPECP